MKTHIIRECVFIFISIFSSFITINITVANIVERSKELASPLLWMLISSILWTMTYLIINY